MAKLRMTLPKGFQNFYNTRPNKRAEQAERAFRSMGKTKFCAYSSCSVNYRR